MVSRFCVSFQLFSFFFPPRLYLDSNVTKHKISVQFALDRHVISPHEYFGNVTTNGAGGIDVVADRSMSAGPAAAFVQDMTLANVISTKPQLKQLPKKLQVAVFGNLTITLGDAEPVTCNNFRMGLSEDIDHIPIVGNSYYWWLSGGLKCVSVPTTAVMNCFCSGKKVQFHVADGAHKVYVLVG